MFVQVQFVFLSISLLANDPEQSSGILKERTVLKGHSMRVSCVAFSPDGTKLATACRVASGARAGERGPELRLWDVATGKECAVEKCSQPYDFEFLAFSPDGKVLANSTGTLWDIVKDKERTCLKGYRAPVLNEDGALLATVAATGDRLLLWDIGRAEELLSYRSEQGVEVLAVGFSKSQTGHEILALTRVKSKGDQDLRVLHLTFKKLRVS